MKKLTAFLVAAFGLAVIAHADPATVSSYTVPNLVDEINTALATYDTRITAAGSVSTSTLTLTNGANNGVCSILLQSDGAADAGDQGALVTTAAGALQWQTDKASQGTLATKFTLGEAGRVTLVGGATLDNDTSASELNITETAVKVTGTFTATGVTTFPVAPKLTAVTAPAAQTLTATNGPAVVSNDSPVWINVTIGTTNYVVAGWAIP